MPRPHVASRPNHSASLFLASTSISASWHLASASQKLASWPRIFTVHMTLINIHNIAIDNHSVVYWLLTENYVLNANILVFMLIHTELFSKVSGLGLKKIFRPRPHSFWPRLWPHAQLASLTSLQSTYFNSYRILDTSNKTSTRNVETREQILASSLFGWLIRQQP